MAMIKCPECGEEISSNARACPHCGCAVTVCPDCGAVYAGEKETCAQCGCVLEKRTAMPSAPPPAAGKVDEFKNRAERFQIIVKVIGLVCTLLLLAAVIVIFFALPNMAKGLKEEGLELSEMKRRYESTRTVIILCAVALSVYGSEILLSVVAQHIFGLRIKSAQDSYKKLGFDVDVKESVDFMCAVEFAQAPERAVKRYALAFLMFLVDAVGAILLCVWAIAAIENFFTEWMWAYNPSEIKLQWNFTDVRFIAGCALILLGELFGFLHKRAKNADKHLIEIQNSLKK